MSFNKGIFDPRQDSNPADDSSFDDIFFSIHGVGDNPMTERNVAIQHLIDPSEPSLQEVRLCKLMIKGMSQVDAYRKAFDVTKDQMSNRSCSSAVDRLLKRPRVARTMYEMRKMLMDFENEDLMQIISELNQDRDLARSLGNPSAAISAVKVKAGLLGLNKDSNTTINITANLSDNQKNDILSRIGHRMLHVNSPAIEDAEYTEVGE
jgi:hypothetical protein